MEPVENAGGVFGEVVIEVLLLHLVVGLGERADELGGQALVFAL